MAKITFTGSINVTRVLKEHIIAGKNGKYLGLAFFENDKPDQYGNDGFVTQEISKEARESGEKGPILGNWKYAKKKPAPARKPEPPADEPKDDDIPF